LAANAFGTGDSLANSTADASLRVYGCHASSLLTEAIVRVQRRLGGLRTKQAQDAIDRGDLDSAADIMLQYYDDSYAHGLSKRDTTLTTTIESTTTDAAVNAQLIGTSLLTLATDSGDQT
jgi:tRNA 2-selenouridine synthase